MMPLTIVAMALATAGVWFSAMQRTRLTARGYGAMVLGFIGVLALLYARTA